MTTMNNAWGRYHLCIGEHIRVGAEVFATGDVGRHRELICNEKEDNSRQN